ncbi:Glutamate--cysteine ligase [hydrothermal vent metagenome]|uniref:glutamate--cysteine ligase n=1 Tax=hydrothermal vent metagenome TaxID=652676 RepID=A0A3B0WCZ9_9ZZZZ
MFKLVESRVKALLAHKESGLISGRQIGVEKECLRVSPEGGISPLAHPAALGSALTNPYITTDYSEALLEFITPPFEHIESVLDFLRDSQTYVYKKLPQDEMLWATSMPCVMACESDIPIANYGASNAGQMKSIYRHGLGHRYGRAMQVIAGVHFNYSLPESFWPIYKNLLGETQLNLKDFQSAQYFSLIRNLQRYGWLIPYLFGASPAVCKSFLGNVSTNLKSFDDYTYYGPYATSLRMGDIGYQNNKENETGVKACYKNVDTYVDSLQSAISTPFAEYEKIGIKKDGKYQQLNTNILQIENEYYSTVRPKQIVQGNEKPTIALQKRGVRYIELRSLDVNAFDPLGINETQLRFVEIFMLFCLLTESQNFCSNEEGEIDRNELLVAHNGRDPALKLMRDGVECKLKDWADDLLKGMQSVAELLDQHKEKTPYQDALQLQRNKVLDPDLTPSARMINEMRETKETFYDFAERMSQKHNQYFTNLNLSAERNQFFDKAVVESIKKQQQIEALDDMSFDDYLQAYFEQ